MPGLFAVALSAILYVALFPPYGLSGLAAFVLVPLCWQLRRSRAPIAAAWAGLWGFFATAGIVAWLVPTARDYFGHGPAIAVAFWLAIALVSAAPQIALCLGLARAGKVWQGAAWPIAFALAWVASEWLRTKTGLQSPWARLGDSQYEREVLRQIADLFGVYGVSFLLALVNAVLADVALRTWDARLEGLRALRPALPSATLALMLVVASFAYGGLRAERWRGGEAALDVLLVQGAVPQELRWSRTRSSQVLRRYTRLTRDALRGQPLPDLVIWPENAIQTSLEHPVYGAATRRLARDLSRPLLLGAPRAEEDGDDARHYNSALFLEPDGNVTHYDKRRLLLFSERGVVPALADAQAPTHPVFSAGERAARFPVANVELATLICMEALYPSLGREAAANGAAAIVNLSNDGWFRGRGAAEQHLAQVRFRAIETRRPLLRVTTSGHTVVVGPDGAIDARLPAHEEGALRTGVREGATSPSFYVRTGDVLPVGALALLVLAAVPGWIRLSVSRK